VAHGCYRDSRAASAAVASSSFAHRILRTWGHKVDTFIALTEFARRKFIEGGLPAGKIHLKPNFVHPDPGPSEASQNYALFVGRISPEKGIDTLLAAWNKLAEGIPLRIVGTGPLSPRVESASSQSDAIEFLDHKSASDVMDLIAGAQFLVVPSIWYETFGLVIVEAFAKAKPVIASRLGAMTELVQDGHTGLLFEPGDPDDLAAKVMWAIGHPAEMRVMGQNAREVYLKNFSAQGNYDRLMEIYGFAVASAREPQRRPPS
jgi:glycosyltransferase involved in cell wall biosynthesis